MDTFIARGGRAGAAGNHAHGGAAAAALVGAPATIVMPSDAPVPKIDNTRALGAEIVFYDRYAESREAIGTAIALEHGATIVPPFSGKSGGVQSSSEAGEAPVSNSRSRAHPIPS